MEILKTETLLPLVLICEGLRCDTHKSLCSRLNVYSEIVGLLESSPVLLDTVQLVRSKLLTLTPKLSALQAAFIYADLALNSPDDLAKCTQEKLEQIVKRLYEIIFKYKGLDEQQGDNYQTWLRSPALKKEVADHIQTTIIKIYELASGRLKQEFNTTMQLYDLDTLRKSLA